MFKNLKPGFTLLEILLSVAALVILASIVILALNPGKQLAQNRNSKRAMDINAIYKALNQYYIDHQNWPPNLMAAEYDELLDICDTGGGYTNDCVNLDDLAPVYIADLPKNYNDLNYRIIKKDTNNFGFYAAGSEEYGLEPVLLNLKNQELDQLLDNNNTSYTLSYTANLNGSIVGPDNQSVLLGEDGIAVEAVPDAGFSFTHWSDGLLDNPRIDTNVVGDISVTANFTANDYNVTFKANGGAGDDYIQSITFDSSEDLNANIFTRTGHDFAGWNTEAGGGGDSYADEAEFTMNVEGITLYAQWVVVPWQRLIFYDGFEDYNVDTVLAGQGGWQVLGTPKFQVKSGGLSSAEINGKTKRIQALAGGGNQEDFEYITFPDQSGTLWLRFNIENSSSAAGPFFMLNLLSGPPTTTNVLNNFGFVMRNGVITLRIVNNNFLKRLDFPIQSYSANETYTIVLKLEKVANSPNKYDSCAIWVNPNIDDSIESLASLDYETADNYIIRDVNLGKINTIAFRRGGSQSSTIQLDEIMIVRDNRTVDSELDFFKERFMAAENENRTPVEDITGWNWATSDGGGRNTSNRQYGFISDALGWESILGMTYNYSGVGSPVANIIWYDKIPLEQNKIEKMSVYLGHNNVNSETRFLIEIENEGWFVMTQPFSGVNIGNVANFPSQAEYVEFNFTTAGSAWRQLNYDGKKGADSDGFEVISGAQTGLVGDLPAGKVIKFGMYSYNVHNSSTRMDNFKIEWSK